MESVGGRTGVRRELDERMTIDPLVMDVLRDPSTKAMGDGLFIRRGVEYQFTNEELLAARYAFFKQMDNFVKRK